MEEKKRDCEKENVHEVRLLRPRKNNDKRLPFHEHDKRTEKNFKEIFEREIDNILHPFKKPEEKLSNADAVCQQSKGTTKITNGSDRQQTKEFGQTEGTDRKNNFKIKYRKPKIARRKDSEILHYDIYNEEYLDDIYFYLRKVERKTIVPTDYSRYQYKFHEMRALAINRLLSIQETIKLSQAEFYLSINLMDQTLARDHFPVKLFELVLLTSIWIVSKLIGTVYISAKKLCLISQTYTIKQLVSMEADMLKKLKFNIHSHEPSIFLNFFLHRLKLMKSDFLVQFCYYILDSFSLCHDFSVYPCSIIAAAVVKVACCTLDTTIDYIQMDCFFEEYLTKEDILTMKKVEAIINCQLLQVNYDVNPFKDVLNNKYPIDFGKYF